LLGTQSASVTGDVREVYSYWTSENCCSTLSSHRRGKR